MRILLLSLLLTFAWNSQITASTGNLQNTIKNTVKNLIGPASEKDSFKYSLFAPPTSQKPFKRFAAYAATAPDQIKIIPKPQIPVTRLGHKIAQLSHVHDPQSLNVVFHAALAKILQLLVVIGTIVLFFRRRHRVSARERCLLALSCASLFALALFTLLPQLAVDYDVTRLFQQSLMVLWLPSVLLAEQLFFFLGRYRLIGAASLFAILYLNLAGFVPQITGGFPPQLPLNNSGIYYDFFYTHTSDIIGTQWLGKNRDKQVRDIKFDSSAALPLVPFKYGVGLVSNKNKGYLYIDHLDTSRHLFRTIIDGEFLEYTNSSIGTDRNLVYANTYAKIYEK